MSVPWISAERSVPNRSCFSLLGGGLKNRVTKLTPGSKRLDFLPHAGKKSSTAAVSHSGGWKHRSLRTDFLLGAEHKLHIHIVAPGVTKEIDIWVCSFKYHLGWYLHTLAFNVVLKLRYPLHTLVYTADYNKITPRLHLVKEEKGGFGMRIWNSLCLILLTWWLQKDLAVFTAAQLSQLETVSKPGFFCHSTSTVQTAVLSNRSI